MNSSPLLMGLIRAVLTFAIVMTAITYSLPHGWSEWHRLERSSLQAQATVVSCQGSGKSRSMSFMYSVDARDYTGSGPGCPAIGSTVPIVFLPDDPTVAALKYSQESVKWLVTLAFVMSIASGFAGAWIARKRAAMR